MPAASIYQLAYISDATKPMSVEELEELLREARTFNVAHHITGALFYCRGLPGTSSAGSYFQVLEGEKVTVRELAASISRDPRNTNSHTLLEGPAPKRLFPDLAMGFVAIIPPDMEALTGRVNPREPSFVPPRADAVSPQLAELMQSLLAEYPPWPYAHA